MLCSRLLYPRRDDSDDFFERCLNPTLNPRLRRHEKLLQSSLTKNISAQSKWRIQQKRSLRGGARRAPSSLSGEMPHPGRPEGNPQDLSSAALEWTAGFLVHIGYSYIATHSYVHIGYMAI